MKPSLHLSIAVTSLAECTAFFVRVMNATVSHEDPSGYVNLEFFGAQLTLKQSATGSPPPGDFHFGVNLSWDEFDALATRVYDLAGERVMAAPRVVDAGTPLERKKMYLRCPSGYLLEIKGYRAQAST